LQTNSTVKRVKQAANIDPIGANVPDLINNNCVRTRQESGGILGA